MQFFLIKKEGRHKPYLGKYLGKSIINKGRPLIKYQPVQFFLCSFSLR